MQEDPVSLPSHIGKIKSYDWYTSIEIIVVKELGVENIIYNTLLTLK